MPTYYGSYDKVAKTDTSKRQDFWTMGRADRVTMRDQTYGWARPVHNGTIQMTTTTKGDNLPAVRGPMRTGQPVWQHMRSRHRPEDHKAV